MTKEQKTEWLAAAKVLLNGGTIEYWNKNSEQWLEKRPGKKNPKMYIRTRYRPKSKPKMIRVYWDDDCGGFVIARAKGFCPPFADYDNSVLVSIDDLLKIDRSKEK